MSEGACWDISRVCDKMGHDMECSNRDPRAPRLSLGLGAANVQPKPAVSLLPSRVTGAGDVIEAKDREEMEG